MKKIVIIGASNFQNPLILKAREMGFETHVFAWKDGSIGEKTADYFYPISITEKDKILRECMKIGPDAVTSIASDLASITVNYVSDKLGLTCNSEHSVKISTNKYDMRKVFKEAGVPTPGFMKVGEESDLREVMKTLTLPIIVKPTDRSGSRGITKLFNFDSLEAAVANSIENSFEKKAIIEEYIEGNEYSFESISFNGVHHFLAVTKKFTTGHPHFIERGHLEPSDLDDVMIDRVKASIFKALDVLQIRNSASHAEFKIDSEGNIRIIEIGARMGGDCIGSDLVQISTGYDFLKMTIQVALGIEPNMIRVAEPKIAVIRFIFSQADYEHLQKIRQEYPSKIYYISDIHIKDTGHIVDSASRFGYYILNCDTKKEAMELAQLC